MLETTECQRINSKGRIFTDCMEFSILRFLHLMMFKSNKKSFNEDFEYNKELNLDIAQDLQDYINKYNKIYYKSDYYSDEDEGHEEREQWAIFVSDRDFFDYYRDDGAELFTNVKNILSFFKYFLKLDIVYEPQTDFNLISDKFKTNNKSIGIQVCQPDVEAYNYKMNYICRFLSKDSDEFTSKIDDGKLYKVIKKTTNIIFAINNIHYQWDLIEMYIDDDTFKNNFITGHSVINKL